MLFLRASLALSAAVGTDIVFWHAAGLKPEASAQGAIVYMLLSLTALLAFIRAPKTGYISARNSRGMIVRPRNNGLDLCVLLLTYAAAQGAVTAILARMLGVRTRSWLSLLGGLLI